MDLFDDEEDFKEYDLGEDKVIREAILTLKLDRQGCEIEILSHNPLRIRVTPIGKKLIEKVLGDIDLDNPSTWK